MQPRPLLVHFQSMDTQRAKCLRIFLAIQRIDFHLGGNTSAEETFEHATTTFLSNKPPRSRSVSTFVRRNAEKRVLRGSKIEMKSFSFIK